MLAAMAPLAPSPPAPTPTWPASPWRLVGRRSLAALALLVGAEFGLQQLGYGQWVVHEKSARYGWRALGHQDALSRDLTVPESINDLGFRDRDWDPPRSDGAGGWLKDETVFRVAVIGNSIAYGSGVVEPETFPRRLEALLGQGLAARGSPRRAVVMNFAVQGYCFEQMARVAEDLVRPYRPDLLVVPFALQDMKPMERSIDDPEYDFRRWVIRTALHDLLARHVFERWTPPPPLTQEEARRQADWDRTVTSLNDQPLARQNRPLFEAAGARLDGLRSQIESDGGRVLVLGLPRWHKHFRPSLLNADAYFGPWASVRRPAVLDARPWPEFERIMQPLVDEIAGRGIDVGSARCLAALSWVDDAGVRHSGAELGFADLCLYLRDDGAHYSPAGHAVLAASIQQAIAAAGLLDG